MKIELTDEWQDPFLWINPKTGKTLRVDQIA
jgi:hypothetical protein